MCVLSDIGYSTLNSLRKGRKGMCAKISVRKGLLSSLPPHTKPYAFRQTLPPSLLECVRNMWMAPDWEVLVYLIYYFLMILENISAKRTYTIILCNNGNLEIEGAI